MCLHSPLYFYLISILSNIKGYFLLNQHYKYTTLKYNYQINNKLFYIYFILNIII